MTGRRVPTIDDIAQPGDYCLRPKGDGGVAPSLWFRLPRSEPCPAGVPDIFRNCWETFWTGLHRIDGTWSITEEAEGNVTVSPSILTWIEIGEDRQRTEWHGFLEHGVWREA